MLSPVLYLASQSPQRAFLLRKAHVDFVVVASTADENAILHDQPQVLAVERARAKARGARLSPQQLAAGATVVGADTVVALGRELFGKPTNRADAVRILTRLQGTSHTVTTGHCCVGLANDGSVANEAVGLAIAKVTMRAMEAAEIQAYVDSGESDGKAGAYAIQSTGDRFVVDVTGSWDTVVGLHLETVARLYRECTDRPLPNFTSQLSGGFPVLGGEGP